MKRIPYEKPVLSKRERLAAVTAIGGISPPINPKVD